LPDVDRALGVWLAHALSGPWLDRVMIAATDAGTLGRVWFLIALIIWIAAPKKRMAAWRLVLSVLLSLLLSEVIIKPMVGRARPYIDHPESRQLMPPLESTSFPSGHASLSVAGAIAVTEIYPAAAVPAAALALLIGTSRVALGVHFPSDVIAG